MIAHCDYQIKYIVTHVLNFKIQNISFSSLTRHDTEKTGHTIWQLSVFSAGSGRIKLPSCNKQRNTKKCGLLPEAWLASLVSSSQYCTQSKGGRYEIGEFCSGQSTQCCVFSVPRMLKVMTSSFWTPSCCCLENYAKFVVHSSVERFRINFAVLYNIAPLNFCITSCTCTH